MLENGIWLGHVISDEHGDPPTRLLWQARSGSNHGKNDAAIPGLENDVSILSGLGACHPLLHFRSRVHDNLSVFVRGIFYRTIRLRFVHHIRPIHSPVSFRCHSHHILRQIFNLSDHQGKPSHPITVRALSSEQVNCPRVRQQLLQPFLFGFLQARHENASESTDDADDYFAGEIHKAEGCFVINVTGFSISDVFLIENVRNCEHLLCWKLRNFESKQIKPKLSDYTKPLHLLRNTLHNNHPNTPTWLKFIFRSSFKAPKSSFCQSWSRNIGCGSVVMAAFSAPTNRKSETTSHRTKTWTFKNYRATTGELIKWVQKGRVAVTKRGEPTWGGALSVHKQLS